MWQSGKARKECYNKGNNTSHSVLATKGEQETEACNVNWGQMTASKAKKCTDRVQDRHIKQCLMVRSTDCGWIQNGLKTLAPQFVSSMTWTNYLISNVNYYHYSHLSHSVIKKECYTRVVDRKRSGTLEGWLVGASSSQVPPGYSEHHRDQYLGSTRLDMNSVQGKAAHGTWTSRKVKVPRQQAQRTEEVWLLKGENVGACYKAMQGEDWEVCFLVWTEETNIIFYFLIWEGKREEKGAPIHCFHSSNAHNGWS